MLIRLVSDIHHEFLQEPFQVQPLENLNPSTVTVCVLAGDIGYPSDTEKMREFFIDTVSKFDHTIMVAGNHEYYSKQHTSMEYIREALQRLCLECGVVFLDRQEYIVDLPNQGSTDGSPDIGSNSHFVRFIGCTLWSKIKTDCECLVERTMNDFVYIHPTLDTHLSVDVYNQLHAKDKHWLTRNIPSQIPTVVITHHLPSDTLVHPYYRQHPLTTSGCFSSSCEYTLAPNVVGWLCGHSHLGYHAMIGKFAIPCWLNPVGYPGEVHTNFDPNFVLCYR